MDAIERAFLDSIIAAPDDDAPRLIFADWLEEGGNPERAEFIRVQCELATHEPDCRPCVLRDREEEILHAHWIEWSDVIGGAGYCMNLYTGRPYSPPNRGITFRRGFIEDMIITAEDWLQHADDLVLVTPLRKVELTTLPQYVDLRYGDQGEVLGVENVIRGFFERDVNVRWPWIKFTLPPTPPFSTAATVLRRNDGDVFELTEADHEIQVGDL